MIAAVYARKSTDQNLPDAEKSVTRQIEHATAYATRKGRSRSCLPTYVDQGQVIYPASVHVVTATA